MVIERRRGVNCDKAEEKKSGRLMRLEKLLREWAVDTDQRRQLVKEEQVHPSTMCACLKEPKDWLGQHEGIERVFTPLRRQPHRRRHVGGPVGETRELAPNDPTERHDPHGHTERAMQLDEREGLRARRCEMDREGKRKNRRDESEGQPVQESSNLVEFAQFGIVICPQHLDNSFSYKCRADSEKTELSVNLFPPHITPAPTSEFAAAAMRCKFFRE
jgi:hypothetical protein